jgi:hypothetical protein
MEVSMTRTLLVAMALLAGCYVPDSASGSGSVTVAASTPDLVAVGPGVSVIADYDEPIFYANGFYWWNYGGYWYRSGYYTGGWVYVDSPPVVIARIGSPYYYRHYRPYGYVARHRPAPYARPVVRDHRSYVRDHRGRRRR